MLPRGPSCTLTRVEVDQTGAVAHAFACYWEYGTHRICWITQLVVHRDFRLRGLASGLLAAIKAYHWRANVYGIMSSHPAACLTAARCFGATIEELDLNFTRREAGSILKSSPIAYIRNAKLRGTLFGHSQGEEEKSGPLVCGVDTEFYVSHEEPSRALEIVRGVWKWPLGDLPEGHEFLVMERVRRIPAPLLSGILNQDTME